MKQQTYRIRRIWVQVELTVLPNVAGLEIKDLHLFPSHTLCFLNISISFFWSFPQLDSKYLNHYKDFWDCPGFQEFQIQMVFWGGWFGFPFLLSHTVVTSSWFHNILIEKPAPPQSIISSSFSRTLHDAIGCHFCTLDLQFPRRREWRSLCKLIFPFPQFPQALRPQTFSQCMKR